MSALEKTKTALPDDAERLKLTLAITGLPSETHELLAATAVEMVKPEPGAIPVQLLKALALDEKDRELLATFLSHFRYELSVQAGYNKLIGYANELDRRGLLEGLGKQLAEVADNTKVITSYLKLLETKWRLTDNDSKALEDYLQESRKDWGDLMLPLIRQRTGGATSVRLKQVFVPLYLRDTRAEEKARKQLEKAQRFEDDMRKQAEQEQTKPVDINELLNRYKAFILLGPPGSGKTTLLRRAALAFAEGRAAEDLGWKGKPLFPIFLRLRNFAEFLEKNSEKFFEPASGALIAYMEHLYQTGSRMALSADFFDRRLKTGDCLVLLDGLDEVTANRAAVAQQVNAFITAFMPYGNQFGLSSRPRGYEGDAKFQLSKANLAIAEVAPLAPTGIGQLICNLLEVLEEDKRARRTAARRLPQRILASKELTQIAGTPLFCSALVQVYLYHKAELPERRVDVLDEIVVLLLGFWEGLKPVSKSTELVTVIGSNKEYREIQQAVEYKVRRLRRLANYMHAELGKYEIESERAKQVLAVYLMEKERVNNLENAETLAKEFLLNSHERSGLLVESNPETEKSPATYAFVHQSFLEFLAATELVNQPGLVKNLLAHIDDSWWEQIILMAGAHPKTPDYQREELVQCLVSAANQQPKGSAEWHHQLIMAGRLARDMAGHLAGPEHQLVEETLHAAMIDTELAAQARANLADVLDEIYLPPDLDCFIPIPATANLPAFHIAKYPVTNSQYQRFLEAPDFAEEKFWLDFPRFSEPDKTGQCKLIGNWGKQGLDWLHSKQLDKDYSPDGKVVHPRYWNDPRFGIARRAVPVVGVSWYEANAYARWLQEHWPEYVAEPNPGLPPGAVRLATETEWIAAAGGGEPGERFPWDKKGEITREQSEILKRANVDESKIGRTTPVGMYPLGASPYGVWDMGGNVWEWQANYYDKDQDYLALLGGSWFAIRGYARVSERNFYLPLGSWNGNGFRLVVSPI